MMALGSIRSLNDARKWQLAAAALQIFPPIFVEEDALLADPDLTPGGITTLRDINGYATYQVNQDYAGANQAIQSLQEDVRQFFFGDLFRLPPPQGTPPSATEVQRRVEQQLREIAPTLGRLQNDMLNPIVERAFRMLARDGQIEPPPDIVLERNAEFDIEYLGQLARAQRTDRAIVAERWVSTAAAIGEVFPEALDVVDADDVMRNSARDLGVSPSSVRDEGEVQELREKREQQQDAMTEATIAEQQGNAASAQREAED